MSKQNRRKFIQNSLLTAGGIGILPSMKFDNKLNSRSSLVENPREIPIIEDTDVIVCGSGPAGISAAVAAARTGVKVTLLEVHGCLGGVWTSGMLSWIFDMEQPGIAKEIIMRLDQYNARRGNNPKQFIYEPEIMKLVLEEMCMEEGIRIRLFTRVVAADVNNSTISHVITESKSGREAWKAQVFIDATGDGDLGFLAGNGFNYGHPTTGRTQPMTLMGLINVKSTPDLAPYLAFYPGRKNLGHLEGPAPMFLEQIRKAGIEPSYKGPTLFNIKDDMIAFMVNHEYGYSALNADDITAATLNARSELHKICKALNELGGPWEGVRLVATAEQIGVREGRRLNGLYTVTWKDALEGVKHEDGVARVTFNIDIHAGGENEDDDDGLPEEMKKYQKHKTKGVLSAFHTKPYDIPLRALIAKDVDNLLMAGRCISGDFYAHGSYRVTGNAVAMGQAAGVHSATCVVEDRTIKDSPWKYTNDNLKYLKLKIHNKLPEYLKNY